MDWRVFATGSSGRCVSLKMLIEFGDAFNYTCGDFRDWCTDVGFRSGEAVAFGRLSHSDRMYVRKYPTSSALEVRGSGQRNSNARSPYSSQEVDSWPPSKLRPIDRWT